MPTTRAQTVRAQKAPARRGGRNVRSRRAASVPVEPVVQPLLLAQPSEQPQQSQIPDNDDDYEDVDDNEQAAPVDVAAVLKDLVKSRRETSKVREPDTFDGSDPKKLQSFLVLCQLNFLDQPRLFQSDRKKINYVLSHLRGTALQWFEMDILNEPDADKLQVYDIFLNELRSNFGPYDAVAEAEDELENLKMKENHKVTKYNVTFNQLAAVSGWDDRALF
jgi:hypothetical protein